MILSTRGSNVGVTGGELEISTDLTIDGDTNNDGAKVTISANQTSRVLILQTLVQKSKLTDL